MRSRLPALFHLINGVASGESMAVFMRVRLLELHRILKTTAEACDPNYRTLIKAFSK